MSKQHCQIAKSRTILSTKSNIVSTLLPFLVTMLPVSATMSNKLNMFNLFRLCRKDEISFDIVVKTGNIVAKNIVAKNCNNVEATFDFVKKTKFYDKLVRHYCHFWQRSRMLLRRNRTLLQWRNYKLGAPRHNNCFTGADTL